MAEKAYERVRMFGSSGAVAMKHRLAEAALRYAIPASLLIAYGLSFRPVQELIGNPAFLLGLIPCLAAAVLLGWRGALVMIAVVALLDRGFALSLPGPETGRGAAVIALLGKLFLAGGLGLVVDSRRRFSALNVALRREIDARRQSEEALRHSAELHRAVVESLGEGVGLFDTEDRVVVANEALARTLQVSPEELLGKRFADFLLAKSRDALAHGASPLERARCYEVVLENSASTLLLVTETKLERNGGAGARTLRVVRDLTDRILSERRQRDLERELQRSQALQSLAVMAGGLAHDFNNLLCGVVGNAEVALRKVPAEAPAVLSHCLTEILNFAGEAAQLSKQMLAFAGQRSLAIEAFPINAELATALRLLRATVESKAQLVLDLGEGLPEIAADRFQLRQVVSNLVLNAVDAMEAKRGTLTLRTGSVRLDADRAARYHVSAGDYVEITVEDTGSGIAVEARERLFEPFFSTKAAGRGMGLAAAAGIVRAHRGWLGVHRTSDQGTSFGILLPVARESARRRSPPPPAASTAAAAARNILLIDDEPAVRVVTGRLLSELGHHVLTAESGRRGLELFCEQPGAVDLVVLDLTMPEQSGEQILGELVLLRDDVSVVITSGFQASDASKLLAVPNVVGFLEKPHTLASLEMVLASVDARTHAPEAASAAPVRH